MQTVADIARHHNQPETALRDTATGLTAVYDGKRENWYYYRFDEKLNKYVETGSTRRFIRFA